MEIDIVAKTETRAQIKARLNERFTILSDFTFAALEGDVTALVVSGPPGVGKSFGVEKALHDWDPTDTLYTITKGYCLTTGLLKLLYKHRKPGNVIVFDDSDTIFGDVNSLNLLKAVCDSTERRVVSYRAESRLTDEDSAELIPQSFTFEGTIIFLTNLDFDKLIEKGHKFSPHLEALVSRAHYIDLTMKNREDFLARIEQVVDEGEILKHLSKTEQKEVVAFINDNAHKMRELSLRMAVKVSHVRNMKHCKNWQAYAAATCCKTEH